MLRWIAVLVFLVQPVSLGAAPATADPVITYHPLVAGSVWVYEVTEDARNYTQTITLEQSDDPGTYVLKASSKMRQTNYFISRIEDRVVLHKIEARLSLLPFHRTKHFDPPLPFLNVPRDLTADWSWSGLSEGYGPDLASIQYHSTRTTNKAGATRRPDLRVAATMTYRDGTRSLFLAYYAAGVGLTDFQSGTYHKTLVSHSLPSKKAMPAR